MSASSEGSAGVGAIGVSIGIMAAESFTTTTRTFRTAQPLSIGISLAPGDRPLIAAPASAAERWDAQDLAEADQAPSVDSTMGAYRDRTPPEEWAVLAAFTAAEASTVEEASTAAAIGKLISALNGRPAHPRWPFSFSS